MTYCSICRTGQLKPAQVDWHKVTLQSEMHLQLHTEASPRIIVGLRSGEDIPSWITHILEVKEGTTFKGLHNSTSRHGYLPEAENLPESVLHTPLVGAPLVEMKGVSVTYGSRKVGSNHIHSRRLQSLLKAGPHSHDSDVQLRTPASGRGPDS